MSDESWVDQHRPETWDEIQGNNKAIKQIRKWAENWSPGDKPQLLVGEPGTGKTTTAFVASDELEMPLNKVNISLTRRSAELKQIVRSMRSSPINSDHQLVLLDEVDNLHGRTNKNELYDELRSPRNPIILTANDEYEIPDPIKRACEQHDFKLGKRSRKAKIKEIADKEDVDLSPSELARLVERPDLRSAINDLQQAAGSSAPVGKDERTWSEGEFPAIQALLGGDEQTWKAAVGYEDDSFGQVDGAILWADENLSQEFRGLEGGVAYQMLASADYWAGKAWERQDFKFQKYAWTLLRFLPEARLSEPFGGYIRPEFPKWFRKSEDKHDGKSDEAKLFRSLKGGERGYQLAGSYFEFKQVHLPILQDLPEEERMELALNHGLGEDAINALDLDPNSFDEWREVEAPEEGDGWSPDSESAAEASW